VYNVVKGETFMTKHTIEEVFSYVVLYAERVYGRGLQARIVDAIGINSSNLNSIVKKGKGTREPVRRGIVDAILRLIPMFPARTYDDFLDLGQWIIDGNSPEEWAPPNHGTISLPGLSFIPEMSDHETDKQTTISSAEGLEGIYHGKLARIFKNKKFASAITHNLDAFDAAIDGDEEMAGLREEMAEIKKILMEMQEQQKADKEFAVPDKKRAAQSNE
jgi:hypothetical protein